MQSTKWTPAENSALVSAYFVMLSAKSAGQKFNKSAVRRALIAGPLAARSEASLEFKFMNVSGCLVSLGRAPLSGYAPAMNYQSDLLSAVSAHLSVSVAA
jgi:hypothetical protein